MCRSASELEMSHQSWTHVVGCQCVTAHSLRNIPLWRLLITTKSWTGASPCYSVHQPTTFRFQSLNNLQYDFNYLVSFSILILKYCNAARKHRIHDVYCSKPSRSTDSFPQSLQASTGIVASHKSRPLPALFVPICIQLICFPCLFDATQPL
jgi:hypothetical protein